jgi:hypothetical protein
MEVETDRGGVGVGAPSQAMALNVSSERTSAFGTASMHEAFAPLVAPLLPITIQIRSNWNETTEPANFRRCLQ